MKKVVMLMCWLVPSIVFAQEKGLNQNSYTDLLHTYQNGNLSKEQLLSLALKAKENYQDSIANVVAEHFKREYLSGKQLSSEITPGLQPYITSFQNLFHIEDALIKYLLDHPHAADAQFQSTGFSKTITSSIIRKEIIDPLVKKDGKYISNEPNWQKVKKKLRKYTDSRTSKSMLTNTKLAWYRTKKDWPNIIKYQIERIECNGLDTAGIAGVMLNNMIYYEIFMHGNDLAVLNKGVKYMEVLLSNKPDEDTWIDTYANLLYKLGKKSEALKHEQRALELARSRNDPGRIQEYTDILQKMSNNHPTWQ